MRQTEKTVSYGEAFDILAEKLLSPSETLNIGSFWEFTRDIWSQGYEHPEYFQTWHIELICADIQNALETGRFYVAILPRYHLKSTVCLAPETLIRTTGTYKCISDIKLEDKVRTHLGRYKKVTKIFKREVSEELLVLSLKNGEKIRITSEHPLLTKDGWKVAKDLSVRDILMIMPSLRRVSPRKGKTYAEYYGDRGVEIANKISKKNLEIFSQVHSHSDNIYIIPIHERKKHVGHNKKWKERGDCKECGNKLKSLWTVFCSYKCRSIFRIKQGLNPAFRFQAFGVGNPSWRGGISVKPYPVEFNEHLKEEIKSRDENQCSLCGASNILRVHHINYDKEDLDRLNLITLCHSCNTKVNQNRDYWKNYFSLEIAKKYATISNGMRIIKIEKTAYSGFVYNLEVEEDETYCGKGVIYHNCGYSFSVYQGLRFPRDVSLLYLSYSDGMSQYHIAEIKNKIRNNPILSRVMTDRVPQADYSFRYKIGQRQFDILHGGLFSFKRGTHVSGGMIADDVLRDPENPLNLTQLYKVENHFLTESIFIPNPNAPLIVLGTPMAPGDLLSKLQEDDRFISRVLPALNPMPGKEVLMPSVYSKEWLEKQKKSNPRSFASEFMLMPYSTTQSYFTEEELKECENTSLPSLDPYSIQDFESDYTVAGVDIGKKRHPSHISLFISKNGKLQQKLQIFLDGWEYERQKEFLNMIANNFNLDRGYYDNTRGELEERGLDPIWRPFTFTEKKKRQLAQVFEQYVHSKNIEFIQDERQRGQIICVDNNLQAPETPLGHGDSFFSNALAILAHYEFNQKRTQDLGDLQELGVSMSGGEIFEKKSGPIDTTDLMKHALIEYNKVTSEQCPNCGEKAGWIQERSLCLICGIK